METGMPTAFMKIVSAALTPDQARSVSKVLS
jgi:hypothetical protein